MGRVNISRYIVSNEITTTPLEVQRWCHEMDTDLHLKNVRSDLLKGKKLFSCERTKALLKNHNLLPNDKDDENESKTKLLISPMDTLKDSIKYVRSELLNI